MSDTIEQTPEQQAAAAIAARAARIDELKGYAGKTFTPANSDFPVITIEEYAGVRVHQESKNGKPIAIAAHVFQVRDSLGRRWTPPATEFLATHKQVEVKAETENIEII